jgi:hypothetical protein
VVNADEITKAKRDEKTKCEEVDEGKYKWQASRRSPDSWAKSRDCSRDNGARSTPLVLFFFHEIYCY